MGKRIGQIHHDFNFGIIHDFFHRHLTDMELLRPSFAAFLYNISNSHHLCNMEGFR